MWDSPDPTEPARSGSRCPATCCTRTSTAAIISSTGTLAHAIAHIRIRVLARTPALALVLTGLPLALPLIGLRLLLLPICLSASSAFFLAIACDISE